MKRTKWMMFMLLAAMVGCKSNDNSLTLLRSHEWELKSMTTAGKTVNNPQQLPTLQFSDSTAVYGSAGCNRFFGTYTTGEKRMMTIKPGGVTMMFCPDMAFEDQYLKVLTEVKSYDVSERELVLKGADDKLRLVYVPVDTTKRVGVANDAHGCNAAAGYTWSEVRKDCVRLFEDGVKLTAAAGQDSTQAAYVVFAADSLQAEVFLPNQEKHPVLNRKNLPQGGYAWNEEGEDTVNVYQQNGTWVIEQSGEVLYRAD